MRVTFCLPQGNQHAHGVQTETPYRISGLRSSRAHEEGMMVCPVSRSCGYCPQPQEGTEPWAVGLIQGEGVPRRLWGPTLLPLMLELFLLKPLPSDSVR